MKKFLYLLSISTILFFIPMEILAETPPAMSYVIGGTISIDDVEMTQSTFSGYSIIVTKEGNIALDPVTETTSLLSSGSYTISISVGAATTGETLEIHVYEGDKELTVDIPVDGELIMGEDGDIENIDISAYTSRTLTILDPDNGTITPNPVVTGNEYAYGTEVSLTAEPDISYVFESWTGDVSDNNSETTTIIMDEDHTVTASFSQCFYTLTMNVNSALMGSVTPEIGANDRACDSDVTITATPAEGYYFSGWTGDVEDSSAATTTVTMDTDHEVTANFVVISHILTIGSGNNGTTNPSSGEHEYGEGTVVTITATANSGYVFSSWTGDVANISLATTTVTMDTDQDVTANFVAAASNDDDNDDSDDGGGGGGGGIFGEINFRDVLGYHFDGNNAHGVGVYMPVTNAYKALKGAQTHVESFAPNVASLVRNGFDILEQKAETNKDGFLYWAGTYTFPILGKIAECYLDIVDAESLKLKAYANTTISVEEFNTLKKQGKAIAPHKVIYKNETDMVATHK